MLKSLNKGSDIMQVNSAWNNVQGGVFKNTNLTKNTTGQLNRKPKTLVEGLQEQVNSITERRTNIKNNENLSIEEKKFKLEELDILLKEAQEQLQQAKMAEKQKELDKAREASEKNLQSKNNLDDDIEREGVLVSKSLLKLMESKEYLQNIHELNVSKHKLKSELSYMKEAPKEEGSFNSKHVSKLRGSILGLEASANNELGKSLKASKESKEIAEENSKHEETKIYESNN